MLDNCVPSPSLCQLRLLIIEYDAKKWMSVPTNVRNVPMFNESTIIHNSSLKLMHVTCSNYGNVSSKIPPATLNIAMWKHRTNGYTVGWINESECKIHSNLIVCFFFK